MKILLGKIISTKMKDTVVVEVVRFVEHEMYRKRMRKTKKYHAHIDKPVMVGEIVKIGEMRPMSKTTNWKVIEKVNKDVTT